MFLSTYFTQTFDNDDAWRCETNYKTSDHFQLSDYFFLSLEVLLPVVESVLVTLELEDLAQLGGAAEEHRHLNRGRN